MNNAALDGFRMMAAAMADGPTDWQWVGQFMSQRHFGITETRAKELAARHGGEARKMTPVAYEIGYEAFMAAANKGGQ